jgi:hypothetical protein
MKRSLPLFATLSLLVGLVLCPAARATTVKHQTIVELIDLADQILVGRVTSVTDGFEKGLPYTEVTLAVQEVVRGSAGSTYTFRQFGLSEPRTLEDGRRYLTMSPQGWPTYAAGDKVLLFLYKPAAKTGLRTTVGLLQGTFKSVRGQFVNGIENRDLFRDITAPEGELTPAEAKLLKRLRGPIPEETLVSFVRKAVGGRWTRNGKLDHVR